MPSISLRTTNFCLVLCVLIPSLVNADPTDYNQEVQDEEPLFSLKEYLSRLANSQNRLYGNSYGSDLIMPDMLRDRRRSSAESNFQLRVRKRAPGPISESNFQLRVRKSPISESNFQLRVRKNLLDRLRSMPQIRSAAEDNFQLRVRKARPGAERNFQLRVRRNGEGPETGLAQQPETEDDYDADLFNRSVRRTLLDQIRDRRFARRPNAENNFQLRVKRSA